MLEFENLKAKGDAMTAAASEMLGISLEAEVVLRLFEAAMGKTCVHLYQVTTLFAHEADKCRKTEAYFTACLMLSSAIEALLALFCLMANGTERSIICKTLKVRTEASFEEKVLSARFTEYVDIAAELNWISSSAVDADLLAAALQDYPLVSANLYPQDNEKKKAERRMRFESMPALEMLRILQHMRNLIHGPRWPRLGVKANPRAFEDDCKFVYVISFQVLACLFDSFSRKSQANMTNAEKLLRDLSAGQLATLREDVLKQLNYRD